MSYSICDTLFGRGRACSIRIGEKFGMLTVEGRAGKGIKTCRCDCGAVVTLTDKELCSGVRSCGCYVDKEYENKASVGATSTRHGKLRKTFLWSYKG